MLRLLTLTTIMFFLAISSVLAQPIVYISSNNNGFVSIIDAATNQVVSTFRLEKNGGASSIAISPDQSTVYFGGGMLSAVSTSNNQIMAQIDVGNINGIAVTPDGNRIFITDSVDDTLTVVRTSDYTVTNEIPLGGAPDAISITPDGTKAYITDQAANDVYVVDTVTVTLTDTIDIPGGSLTRGICVEPGGAFVYATSQGSDDLTVIDTATDTVVTQTTLGDGPQNIAFNSSGTMAYIANSGSDDVSVVRTIDHSVTGTIPTSADTLVGISITPDDALLYATGLFSDNVIVISTASNTAIDVIGGPLMDGLINDGRFIANVPPPMPEPIPTLSEWGLIAMAGVLFIAGLLVVRKRTSLT